MPLTRRPGRPIDPTLHERRRAEILDAAARHFAARGYAGTDTQHLADSLGIAKGTVFRYFPTKRELFVASIHRALDRLGEAVETVADGVDDPLEKLRAATAAYLAFFDRHPEVVELLILERAELKAPTSAYFSRRVADPGVEDRWTAAIRRLVAGGVFRPLPVERILGFLGELVYGVLLTHHLSGRNSSLAARADDLFDLACHGLLAGPRARGAARRRRSAAAPAPAVRRRSPRRVKR